MEFQAQGRPFDRDGMQRTCDLLGVSQPEVWAVLTVETKGFGFLPDRRPQILFERHIFHKLTNGRHDAGNADVSNAAAGGYVGRADEYPRLQKAMALDRDAALQSASWGVGQVMGFNHGIAGFPSVTAMVDAMVRDENAQLLAVASFIKSTKLDSALQRQDWRAFAAGYNGADFAKNQYDTRLAKAHVEYKTILPNLALRSAQAALTYLSFNPGPVDGVIGQRTRAALTAYQQRAGLPQTGALDAATESRLLAEAFGA
jgi:N-acetylmuramidase-like protein/putative peptidoglycan binding protein